MLDWITKNWALKLLSLVIAFTFWVAVTGEGEIVREVNVPLEIALGEGFTLAGSPPTTATVRLRGPETILRRLDRFGMEILLDLKDASPGERTVHLAEENLIGCPRGVEVDRIIPDRLSLEVAFLAQRPLPVVPSFSGQPPAGYSFYGARVVPDTLTVEGPKREVDSLSRLRTDPIPLGERTAPFTARVGAVPDSPDVRVLEARLLDVRVDVDVAPAEVVFDSVPVVLAGQVFEAAAAPSSLRVTLAGPPALLKQILPGQLRAVADVSGLEPRSKPYQLSPRIEFADIPARDLGRIRVKSVSRESVSVRLSAQRIAG